jgi:hypothetical protein
MRKKGWLLLAFLATVLGNVMKMDLKDNAVAYRPMQKHQIIIIGFVHIQ